MPLTEVGVRNARADEKPRKLFDAHGLFLFVTPKGGKLWRLKYRFGGKEKLLSLGPYPLLGLREARDARDTARRLLIAGDDPGSAKANARQAAVAAANNTFRQIAEEYRAKLVREGRAPATLEKIEWYLTFVLPALGELEVQLITAAQVLEVLRTIESRGRYETARKTRSTVGAIFRYAIATARAENDPSSALRGALTRPTVKSRAAILDPAAFGGLLRAVWAYDGSPEVVAALKLLALLYPRPGELRHAEWSEFDLDGAVWTVPASRMKMRRPHRVPLSRKVVEILTDLKAKRTHATPLAFPPCAVLRAASARTPSTQPSAEWATRPTKRRRMASVRHSARWRTKAGFGVPTLSGVRWLTKKRKRRGALMLVESIGTNGFGWLCGGPRNAIPFGRAPN